MVEKKMVTLRGGPKDGMRVEVDPPSRWLHVAELLEEHPDYLPQPFDEDTPIADWVPAPGEDPGTYYLRDRWPRFRTHRYDLITGEYAGWREDVATPTLQAGQSVSLEWNTDDLMDTP